MDLFEAFAERKRAAFRRLLQSGADPDSLDRYGASILYRAAGAGDVASMRLLLRHGADVNKRLRVVSHVTRRVTRDAVALHAAGWAKEARVLLKAGADPDAQDHRGVSALMRFAPTCRFELVALLQKHRARAGLRDKASHTAADHVRAKLEWWQSHAASSSDRGKRPTQLRRMLRMLASAEGAEERQK